MSNRACWLSIGLLAALLTWALNWPAWAETRQGTFCDTQDEITAIVQYDGDAMTTINRTFEGACNTVLGRFVRGKPVEYVRHNKILWEITPVFLYGIGLTQKMPRPIEQWASFSSELIEVTWDGKSTDQKTKTWFESLMQPDNPTASCCGQADAVEADVFTEDKLGRYVAIVTDGKGIVPTGTHIPIPNAKIKWDAGNPSGHGVVFIHIISADEEEATQAVGTIQVYCYVTPAGG